MQTEKTHHAEDEINLLDYVIVIMKWKRLIVGITLACMAVTAIAGLMLPKIYRAETRILPPQQNNAGTASQLLSQVGGGLSGLSGMLGTSQTDLYVGMLQSRTVLDNIIRRFDLRKLYDVKTSEDARKHLTNNINVQGDAKSNVVVISVEDRVPQRAADMANAFVEELKGMTKGLAVTEAAQRRFFFEEQLKETKEALIKAEERVKGFQEKTGALHVEEQVKAVIKNISELRAGIAAKEVEIKVLKTYSKANNPDLQKAEATLSGMKAELSKLESKHGTGNDPMMSTGRMPSVGTEYVRRLRDLKFNESLHDLLLKQYEAAKLDEARDAAVIQVIDRAVQPEKRAKPKRTAMVAIAGAVSFLLSIVLALLLDYRERVLRDPGNSERIVQLKKFSGIDAFRVLAMKRLPGKLDGYDHD
ncbi:hypothetical protein F6V30_09760 [Oryzomonas sagensis]|uniref:Uncharacterized protein n=1 Tax=Oryzomonas sagensis TaxID=2603857 RepID=A0ABQ6TPH0_9BACT|nr:Wzz/FepE/Etk N-terminal domain-containing protein [Oryzomonas sagensis]KAB0670425.1 hypothetical protein F6V30_09760 [Oryzomonas sagensis]